MHGIDSHPKKKKKKLSATNIFRQQPNLASCACGRRRPALIGDDRVAFQNLTNALTSPYITGETHLQLQTDNTQ